MSPTVSVVMFRMAGKGLSMSLRSVPSPTVKRWRIEAQVPGKQMTVKRFNYTSACRMCAIDKAIILATSLSNSYNVPLKDVEWVIRSPKGHLREYEVVASNRTVGFMPVAAHAH